MLELLMQLLSILAMAGVGFATVVAPGSGESGGTGAGGESGGDKAAAELEELRKTKVELERKNAKLAKEIEKHNAKSKDDDANDDAKKQRVKELEERLETAERRERERLDAALKKLPEAERKRIELVREDVSLEVLSKLVDSASTTERAPDDGDPKKKDPPPAPPAYAPNGKFEMGRADEFKLSPRAKDVFASHLARTVSDETVKDLRVITNTDDGETAKAEYKISMPIARFFERLREVSPGGRLMTRETYDARKR